MKERVRSVLECEGDKEIKGRGGEYRDRLDRCVEDKNKKKKKKEMKTYGWEWIERKEK